MRKRRKAFVLLICVAAALALITFLSRDSEPRYQGRSLSQWYVLWTKSADKAQAAEAASAIREIGTNALPTLLERLKSQYSPGRRALFNIVGALPSAISENEVAPVSPAALRTAWQRLETMGCSRYWLRLLSPTFLAATMLHTGSASAVTSPSEPTLPKRFLSSPSVLLRLTNSWLVPLSKPSVA